MIKVGDIIKLKRKEYLILSVFTDPSDPNELFYIAKTSIGGSIPSYRVLTKNSEGKLFVHI